MATHPLPRISPEEYLERERAAPFRSEYIFGQMYGRAGASFRHNRINRNILTLLNRIEGCEALSSDQRIYSPKDPFFAYPDTLLCCGEPQLLPGKHQDTLVNPGLIVEVLSDSTRSYDLGLKFSMYKDIPSFREYLAIEQNAAEVHHFWRNGGGNEWKGSISEGGLISLVHFPGDLSLDEIYRGIVFD